MNSTVLKSPAPPRRVLLPQVPILAYAGGGYYHLTPEGEIGKIDESRARDLAQKTLPIVCHAPQLAKRLGIEAFRALDVLELFAFVHPGRFCVPTPAGLAEALNLLPPLRAEDTCLSLLQTARHLILDLVGQDQTACDSAALAAVMGLGLSGTGDFSQGWPWTQTILTALDRKPSVSEMRVALSVWNRLPEWAAHAPEPPAGHEAVRADQAQERLSYLLRQGDREPRGAQKDYTAALVPAFAPVMAEEEPNVVLAEAGTGTGKTLGYLAPASLWAEKNGGAVWVSTYTRNLQRQVDEELDRLYPDRTQKAMRAVIRKGRENYLCLLNYEDATQSPTLAHSVQNAVAVGIISRWIATTRDGDFSGADFPGWLVGVLGWQRTLGFADRAGECVYAGCAHFDRCFIEKSIRKAKRADIVIANHALVMRQSTLPDEAAANGTARRFVFDEGHHLFEAADGAFSTHLCGAEAARLRRWILGAEGGPRSRARGLRRRLEDLIGDDEKALQSLDEIIDAAHALPGPAWRARLVDGKPKGATEEFLFQVRAQVLARCRGDNPHYSLETSVNPALPELIAAGQILQERLLRLKTPMAALAVLLLKKLDDEAADLSTSLRNRLQSSAAGLQRRVQHMVSAWAEALEALNGRTPPEFCDWLEITRVEGNEEDMGLYRHHIDPTVPFAAGLRQQAQGVAITSATLRDGSEPSDWQTAALRTGAHHLTPAHRLKHFDTVSPFNYAHQTKILVVGDVKKEDMAQVSAAYRELFLAAGGGALGIFTAVQRLKAVGERLKAPLEQNEITLYAQHLDGIDVATLLDMFRLEENACLLGTDATRDGVDVPGRSLRMIVFDRVPWPRPTLLHKARRDAFGKGYDDMLTRFKLKQAYGRLIRKADDQGVFVMLDGAFPTRLLTAFPPGVEVVRTGLKDAIEISRQFLDKNAKTKEL